MKKQKFKISFIAVAVVFSMLMSVSVSAQSTGFIQVGSGNTGGYVCGYLVVSGNSTTGYYSNASTIFNSQGKANTGVIVTVKLTVKNGSTTLYTNSKSASGVNDGQTDVSLYAGTYPSYVGLTGTSVHTLTGTLSWSRTQTASY